MSEEAEVFDDLPVEGTPEGEPLEEAPEQEDVAELKSQLDKANALVKEKDLIAKNERARRKSESDARRSLESRVKELEEGDEAPEAVIAEAVPVDTRAIVDQAKSELKAEGYNEQIISLIKQQPNITRAEAKAVLEIVEKLPKSGNPSLDVEFAFDYRAKVSKQDRGFNAPAMAGAGYVRSQAPAGGIRPETLEVGKQFKLTKEDFDKHSGDIQI